MYLRQLELKGFKSFADNTEIYFQPGINIIVGPNGCGKSNIVDAIRWVLGESNIRNLRGQKAEDVIFTGTDKKRPLGFASASMTIDNEDLALNNDFSEITVTRRVHRSGDSDFMINRREVRLKDIHRLFAGTGLGKKGYSIIGQGELEQILNARPYERRLILEEAAGLVVYRQKKEEAQHKLEHTAQDMLRVRDILLELESRVSDLSEKAVRARAYLTASDEIGILERKVLAFELSQYREDLLTKTREMSELNNQLAAMRAEYSLKEAEHLQHKKQIEELTAEIQQLKDKRYEIGSEFSHLENEAHLSAERIANARERIGQLDADGQKYANLAESLQGDLQIARNGLTQRQEQLQQKEAEFANLSEQMESTGSGMVQMESAIEALKNDVIDLLNEEAALKNRLAELEEKKKRFDERMARANNERNYRQEKAVVIEESIAALKREAALEDEAFKKLAAEKDSVTAEKNQKNLQNVELERQIVDFEKKKRELDNRLLSIEQALNAHLGHSDAVKKLLQAAEGRNHGLTGIIGVVSDLIDVPPGLETAVEAAAGRGLDNIVVAAEQDASRAITLLKDRSWGKITFLPLNILRPGVMDLAQAKQAAKLPGVLGLATELVKYDSSHKKAVDYILGRTLIVENLHAGLAVFKEIKNMKIVTLEGDIINASGAMTGGKNQSKGPSPLMVKAEQKKCRQELAELNTRLQDKQTALDNCRAQTASLEETIRMLNEKSSERGFRLAMVNKELTRTEEELTATRRELENITADQKGIDREMAELQRETGEQTEEFNRLSGRGRMKADELKEVQEQYDQAVRQHELTRERLRHAEDSLNNHRNDLNNQQVSLNQLLNVESSYRSALENSQTEIKRLHEIDTAENVKMKSSERARVELNRELARVNGLIKVLDARMDNWKQAETMQEEEMQPMHDQIVIHEEKCRNMELRYVRAETEAKNAQTTWDEKFPGELYEPFAQGLDNRQQRENRKRVEVLRGELESLGIVDIGSISELESVEARRAFLDTQLQDLNSARESLNQLIRETERTMNQRFAEFITMADQSFKTTFTGIFRGGEAELILENHEDAWQAGVEIMVKMPGKRRQPLNLLSGGERALTCIAFIFALLLLKPAPFCLLDEIDAALDEVNLTRFTEYLKKLSPRIQFLVITHRQGTIEAGDAIYGVTMPEQGVSDVLAVSLKEAESMAG